MEALEALQRVTHLDLGGVPAPSVARLARHLPSLASLVIKFDVDREFPTVRPPRLRRPLSHSGSAARLPAAPGAAMRVWWGRLVRGAR